MRSGAAISGRDEAREPRPPTIVRSPRGLASASGRSRGGARLSWRRMLAPAAALVFALGVVAAAVGLVRGSRADDGAAMRGRLADALAELRAEQAQAAEERARAIAGSASGAFTFGGEAARWPEPGSRAYLLSGDGGLVASHPADNRTIPASVASLAEWFRHEQNAPADRKDADAAAPALAPAAATDVIEFDDRPAVAAVAPVAPSATSAAFPTAAAARPALLVVLAPLNARLVDELGRRAGAPGLRLENAPLRVDAPLFPLADRRGRIVGLFGWDADRAALRSAGPDWPILALGGLGLFGLFGLALVKAAQAKRALAESERRWREVGGEDPLTRIPARGRIIELLDAALAERRPEETVAFACLNIDGFKEINGALGHATGDELLVATAKRLRAALPPSAALGRLDGDEFAAVLTVADETAAMDAAKAFSQALAAPIVVRDHTINVSASIGLAHAPHDGDSDGDLIRRADLAARAAKKNGRGRILAFHRGLEAEINERRFIERELRQALAEERLDIAYQPIVAGDGLTMIGAEALVRWSHPTRGAIPPTIFVAVAEQTGMMMQLGKFVMRRALADAAAWPDLYVAVNLSPLQVRDRGLVRSVDSAIAEAGIDPTRLVLEITEGMLIENPEEAKQRLKELRALGVKIALDDFGSGYSSLNYLRRLPIDKLKIDKEFVSPLGRSANGGVIVQAIVTLGRALGLSVLAEGVETEEQRVLLRLAGCDELQGYLFARPMPKPALSEFRALAVRPACPSAPALQETVAAKAIEA